MSGTNSTSGQVDVPATNHRLLREFLIAACIGSAYGLVLLMALMVSGGTR